MLLYQKIKIILFEAEMLVGIRKQISKCFGQKIYLVVCTERHSFFVLRGKLLSFHEIQAASENMHHLIFKKHHAKLQYHYTRPTTVFIFIELCENYTRLLKSKLNQYHTIQPE